MARLKRRTRRPPYQGAAQPGVLEQIMAGLKPAMGMMPMLMMQGMQRKQARADTLADRAQAERDRIAAELRQEGRNISAAERAATQEGLVYRRGQEQEARNAANALTPTQSPDAQVLALERIQRQFDMPPDVLGSAENWLTTPSERVEAAAQIPGTMDAPTLAMGDIAVQEAMGRVHMDQPLTEQIGPPTREGMLAPLTETIAGERVREATQVAQEAAIRELEQQIGTAGAETGARAAANFPYQVELQSQAGRSAAWHQAMAQQADPGVGIPVRVGGSQGNAVSAPYLVASADSGEIWEVPKNFEGMWHTVGAVNAPGDKMHGIPYVSYKPIPQAVTGEQLAATEAMQGATGATGIEVKSTGDTALPMGKAELGDLEARFALPVPGVGDMDTFLGLEELRNMRSWFQPITRNVLPGHRRFRQP